MGKKNASEVNLHGKTNHKLGRKCERMFAYQDGKLYAQHGDKLVGVEIYSDQVVPVEGTETVLGKEFEFLTLQEVRLKFNIVNGEKYIFPKEVIEGEPTSDTQSTTKRTRRK